MYPVLFKIGPVTIHTYGVFIAAAFLLGINLAARRGAKEGIDSQKILDLCFYILIAAIIGARILYVITEYQEYLEHPFKIFKIWEGGLVFYGGYLLGIAAVIYFLQTHDLPLWKTADILAPYIALGQSIGRWGCFFAGCCHGKPSNLPWAITFTNPKSLAILNTPLHPTQIYHSLANFFIFLILLWRRPFKKFEGELIWTYTLLYALGRFIIEFFRGDERGSILGGILSTSQAIGIILFIGSLIMLYRLRKQRGQNP